MWCVFFLSLLLLQPWPSLIIGSEKVIYVPELRVTAEHPRGVQHPIRASSLAMESFGPCLAINNHLLQRSFLQSTLCLSTQLSVSLLFL